MVDDLDPPNLYLTDFWLFNKRIEPAKNGLLQAPLSKTTKIVLSHDQQDISIGFVGIHFKNPSGNRYDYRLRPYDRDWRGVTELRRATYTALPPGEYTFEVKAANSDGTWTQAPVALDLVILPPWWRTRGAYFIYLLLIIGIVYLADRIQRRRLIFRER